MPAEKSRSSYIDNSALSLYLMDMKQTFPFAAILGQSRLKAALLACAVDPSIGGVLIRGEKGTAKTTIVRGLASLLPEIDVVQGCPYSCNPEDTDSPHRECADAIAAGGVERQRRPVRMVELPLNASEDRLVGSIELEESLRSGQRRFEPGILASANRGILYIDEVNLLEDHLVDLVLDAAASGVNRLEREGFSMSHPARFLLIGTMNPEEGELRPQFLDRFALSVTVKGENEPAMRKQIALRRIAYERDPEGFNGYWREEQQRLRLLVESARRRLAEVEISDEGWDFLVGLSASAGVQGHRSDIVMAKTATALAALRDHKRVGREELLEAARLSLLHRIAGSMEDTPESVSTRLEELLDEGSLKGGNSGDLSDDSVLSDEGQSRTGELQEQGGAPSAESGSDLFSMMEDFQVPGAAASGSIVFDFVEKKNLPSVK